MNNRTLMVIVPDRLSDLLKKGEIVDRYYNPGEVFDEVHIVMVNDDQPDPALVQRTVGAARLVLHNVAAGKLLFLASLCWRPFLLKAWAGRVVALARRIGPALIRCHGAHLNAYAAAAIKRELGIPYLVSIHTNAAESLKVTQRANMQTVIELAQRGIEKVGLRHADLVMPVYEPIVSYLEQIKVRNFEVCYNVLNPANLRKKDDYNLSSPIRVVSVGRQIIGKNPVNLIRAMARLEGVHLTMIGDGCCHDGLVQEVQDLGMSARVTFHKAIANDALCRSLAEYDLFAVHSDYAEISKSVLEALLTGLPLIINKRVGFPVPELTGEICVLVDNNVDGYRKGLEELIANEGKREGLGRRAYAWAQAHWSPKATEARFAAIYRQYALSKA